jgi:hypothetical protein
MEPGIKKTNNKAKREGIIVTGRRCVKYSFQDTCRSQADAWEKFTNPLSVT